MSEDDIKKDEQEDDIFVKAALRRAKREKEAAAGILECIVCGVKNDIEGIEITKYDRKHWCQRCLAIEKAERKKAREDKKAAQAIDADEIASKVSETIGNDLVEIKSEIQKIQAPDQWKLGDEMKEILTAVVTEHLKDLLSEVKAPASTPTEVKNRAYPPTKENILIEAWESTVVSVGSLKNVFRRASGTRVQKTLQDMRRTEIVKDEDGGVIGKMLWNNRHSWNMINPNIPYETYIRITNDDITEQEYYEQMKAIIDRATKGKKDDELFKEWDGKKRVIIAIRKEVKDRIRRVTGSI